MYMLSLSLKIIYRPWSENSDQLKALGSAVSATLQGNKILETLSIQEGHKLNFYIFFLCTKGHKFSVPHRASDKM